MSSRVYDGNANRSLKARYLFCRKHLVSSLGWSTCYRNISLPSHSREDLNSSIDTIVNTAAFSYPRRSLRDTRGYDIGDKSFFSDVFKDEEEATQTDDNKLLAIVGVLSVLAIFIGIIAMMADKTDPLKEAQEKDIKIRNQVSELIYKDKPSTELTELEDKRKGMIYVPAGAMLTGKSQPRDRKGNGFGI